MRKQAPPNRAVAAIGVILGGCGASLASAAATTIPTKKIERLFKCFSLLVRAGRRSQTGGMSPELHVTVNCVLAGSKSA